jgi:hypothetical protein
MKPELLEGERKKFVSEVAKVAQPVDFSDLERRGVISKAGAWYRVHDWSALPAHVTCKIYEVANDSKGTKVKITSAFKTQRFAKKMEKMGFITTKK